MKRSVVVGILCAVFCAPSPAWAFIFPINPKRELTWGRVLYVLNEIRDKVQAISSATTNLEGTLAKAFPDDVLHPLEDLYSGVRSIMGEVEDLSCKWAFAPRAERLRLALFEGADLCRDEWEAIFGPVPATYDRDLDQMLDWTSILRIRAIGGHIKRNEEAVRLQERLIEETQWVDVTGSQAERYAAQAAAKLGNHLLEQQKLAALRLELSEERAQLRSRKKRQERTAVLMQWRALAGLPPMGQP